MFIYLLFFGGGGSTCSGAGGIFVFFAFETKLFFVFENPNNTVMLCVLRMDLCGMKTPLPPLREHSWA